MVKISGSSRGGSLGVILMGGLLLLSGLATVSLNVAHSNPSATSPVRSSALFGLLSAPSRGLGALADPDRPYPATEFNAGAHGQSPTASPVAEGGPPRPAGASSSVAALTSTPTAVGVGRGNAQVSAALANSRSTFSVSRSYPVTFTESGLPPSTLWSVNLSGNLTGSTTPTIAFEEPNGFYTYVIQPVGGYDSAPTTGSMTVNDASESVLVSFYPQQNFTVTFAQTGLPNGTSWWVNLSRSEPLPQGRSASSDSGTLTFELPNGTYPYYSVMSANKSYWCDGGAFVVNGAPVSVAIVFQGPGSTSSGGGNGSTAILGLPGGTGYALLGALLAATVIGVAAVAFLVLRKRFRTPKAPSEGPPPPESR